MENVEKIIKTQKITQLKKKNVSCSSFVNVASIEVWLVALESRDAVDAKNDLGCEDQSIFECARG